MLCFIEWVARAIVIIRELINRENTGNQLASAQNEGCRDEDFSAEGGKTAVLFGANRDWLWPDLWAHNPTPNLSQASAAPYHLLIQVLFEADNQVWGGTPWGSRYTSGSSLRKKEHKFT